MPKTTSIKEKSTLLWIIKIYQKEIINLNKIEGMAKIEAIDSEVKDFCQNHPRVETEDLKSLMSEIKKTYIKLFHPCLLF